MKELRNFIEMKGKFETLSITDNIDEALFLGYNLLVSLKKINDNNIQNFINVIEYYFDFNIEKDGDWKNIKISLPEIDSKVPITKIINRSQYYKEWNPGIKNHRTMYSVIQKNVTDFFDTFYIYYEFLVLNPI